MFAGPNGSGKSELKKHLRPELLGVYLNPDEFEQGMRTKGFLDLSGFGVTTTPDEVLPFFRSCAWLISSGFGEAVKQIRFAKGRLDFANVEVNSYLASVAVDFLRQKLLERQVSFTFETVMSHPNKVELLEQAQRAGYRTYLYFIATEDPEINISRVRNRVQLGGHAVPEDRIAPRYHRSLALLMAAIRHTDRAYIFDNSSENADHSWIAEITEGKLLELKSEQIPAWFKRAMLDKINSSK
ncbi:MAG: zeta toxin family protein [Verrucomicrobia bacterium]|nr:zeta toxin family protein [Verrucomicrobiota bacterium]